MGRERGKIGREKKEPLGPIRQNEKVKSGAEARKRENDKAPRGSELEVKGGEEARRKGKGPVGTSNLR